MRTRVVVGLVLAVAWAAAALAFADSDSAPDPDVRSGDHVETAPGPRRSTPAAPAPTPVPPVVMVRRAHGVPAGWPRRAARIPGVARVVRVRRGQALLRRTIDGRTVEAVRPGHAVPIDTLVASPRAYASMLPADVRRVVAATAPGEAVLSRTGAALRRVGSGAVLSLAGGGRLRVAAVVDDAHLNGAEMLVARRGAGIETRAAHMLVRLRSPRAERSVEREFRGDRVRVVARGGVSPGTARGGIVRPAELKQRFGEVAVRLPYGRDWVKLDPAWVRRNIVSARVPVLGRVTCNRRMLPALLRALREVERRGLGRLIDRGDYAGCWAPRRIPASGSLSLHALGLAVDFNASTNGQYREGDQNPRLVRIMERHGFTWGGRWPTAPDPMHFEWQGATGR